MAFWTQFASATTPLRWSEDKHWFFLQCKLKPGLLSFTYRLPHHCTTTTANKDAAKCWFWNPEFQKSAVLKVTSTKLILFSWENFLSIGAQLSPTARTLQSLTHLEEANWDLRLFLHKYSGISDFTTQLITRYRTFVSFFFSLRKKNIEMMKFFTVALNTLQHFWESQLK